MLPRQALLTATALSLGLGLALAGAGCKYKPASEEEVRREAEVNARRVTADSTADATKPVVDEDYAFRLDRPSTEWKLMAEAEAQGINPDACAGAMHEDGVFAQVIVQRLPGMTVEQAAELSWSSLTQDTQILSTTEIERDGVRGLRREFTTRVSGRPMRYLWDVYYRDEHVYDLLSWGPPNFDASRHLPIHDAFAFLPGPVRDRERARAPVEAHTGVAWHIEDRRYASVVTGLALTPPESWEALVGADLELLNAEAEIAWTHQGVAYVQLIDRRAPGDEVEAFAAISMRDYRAGFGEALEILEPVELAVAGTPTRFDHLRDATHEYLYGFRPDGNGRGTTAVLASFARGRAEELRPPTLELIATIEALPDAARAELRRELLDDRNRQRVFDGRQAFRAGQYLDFEHRISWTAPPGFWWLDSFAKARTVNSPETRLWAQERELGLYLTTEVFEQPEQGPSETLDSWIEGFEILGRSTVKREGRTAHRALVRIEGEDGSTLAHYEIVATRDRLIGTTVWTSFDTPAHRELAEAALAGLRYDFHESPTSFDPSTRRFLDLEYGVGLEAPKGLELEAKQGPALGRVAGARDGRRELTFTVMPQLAARDREWLMSFVEQVFRERLNASMKLGEPERSTSTVGGLEARHLSWPGLRRVALDIVVRDRVGYAILYGGLSEAEIAAVQRSFHIIE